MRTHILFAVARRYLQTAMDYAMSFCRMLRRNARIALERDIAMMPIIAMAIKDNMLSHRQSLLGGLLTSFALTFE